MHDKVSIDTINDTQRLPIVRDNKVVLTLIANGVNIWDKNYTLPFIALFCNTYSNRYSALPTNTQFGERGVKESGYVTLGHRNESSRSVLAISRGKLLHEALAVGRDEIQSTEETKIKQLQGKKKAKIMMREFFVHDNKIKQLFHKRKQNGYNVNDEKRKVKNHSPTLLSSSKPNALRSKCSKSLPKSMLIPPQTCTNAVPGKR